ncbi:hypothetical protein [Paenibacillus glycinis]|uniref:Uncharacterized protein n=1 Tax=Paenibacillus glycinis TaxID=2697035 RepID=A0ABW9XQ40_9BACL|nr:hypothetical protein [Paenibacillus glycinis]NBD24666.1 hypothetical protein [Paenibacillus glycinis]
MRILNRKPINGTLVHAGIKTHASLFGATATADGASAERGAKFTTGMINGALLVAPFWLLVAWLVFHN